MSRPIIPLGNYLGGLLLLLLLLSRQSYHPRHLEKASKQPFDPGPPWKGVQVVV